MERKVLSFDESSPPFSTVAGGTDVVVSVDWAEGAGEPRAALESRSDAGAGAGTRVGGGELPFEAMIACGGDQEDGAGGATVDR